TYAKSLGGKKIWLRNEIYVQFVDTSSFRIYALPLLTTYDVATYNYEGDNEFHLVCNDEEKMVLLANLLYQHFSTEYSTVDFYSDMSIFSNNDTHFSDQWGLHNTGQNGGTSGIDIKATEAWNYIQNNISSVNHGIKVAVIDDGVEPHEDFYYDGGVCKVLDGYTANGDGTGRPRPNHAHGQCCAGIIGAVHNNIGVAGVAPYSLIIPFRIFKNNGAPFNEKKIADAIHKSWNDFGADVLSNSWGGGPESDLITKEIQKALAYGRGGKGCVVVFASGNDNHPSVEYPSSINGVISVGAIDHCGVRSGREDIVYASCDPWIAENGVPSPGSSYGDKLSVVAPGTNVYTTDRGGSDGYKSGNYYEAFGGTSAACPHVAGVAALVLSVNPNLTGQRVKNIIESTAQKIRTDLYTYSQGYYHPNGSWNDTVGYGLVNAYAAVKKALPDLYIRDDASDNGNEPSTANPAHNSPDIWTTDLKGNVCNPTGDADCYVCVRVRNRSSFASLGNEKLIVNWAKAGVSLYWKGSWTGSLYFWNSMPRGGYVTSTDGITIPSIPAGRDTVLRILWHTPDPEDYSDCIEFSNSSEVWHFCLAARVHDGTPIVGENDNDLLMRVFTRNNNNVAWKNISIISGGYFSAIVNACNLSNISKNYTINLTEVTNANTPSITDNAEVFVTLDAGLLAAINGNASISGLDWVNSNTLRWVGGNACIPVTLSANSDYAFMTTVHFIADQIPATNNFNFDVEMRNPTGDTVLGGEHYQCIRTNGRYFQAVAHDNMTVLWGETATLYADDILETAEYVWYDEQGDEVGNGLTCNVTPQQNTTYTLRVTADADGYRAYSTVDVMVVDGELRLLAPNPADNQVRIGY
ncbi:MAG: S8 family serine peptidase, partial [Bacteroidales bacterium]|nr:S8 family serine peptidase [Bacteroidales bacterium]